jgi:phosphoglycolate phosphatase-like HAD superfamily hydrolase
MTKKIVIFDIDGTLANIEHRRAFVRDKPKNWPAFNKAMVNDTPHDDVIWLFKLMQNEPDTIMLVASGRGEEDREKTEKWLLEQRVVYQKLYMRPAKDSRRDDIIKEEILAQIRAEFGEPYMAIDDRNQVVDMWRRNGLRCLQVAPGDF